MGIIHAARLDRSPRLQRLRDYLRDGQWHTTLDIIAGAQVCAVNSAVCELRCNGLDVQSRAVGRVWEYRMVA